MFHVVLSSLASGREDATSIKFQVHALAQGEVDNLYVKSVAFPREFVVHSSTFLSLAGQ